MNAIVAWRIIHILFAASWFGGSLSISADARRALSAADSGGELLIQRASKSFSMSFFSMIVTFGSGLALVFAKGGMGAIDTKIHMAMGLTLLCFLIRAAVSMPALGKIRKGVSAGGADAEEAKGKVKLLAMGIGIEHLLWLVTLCLMVASIYWTGGSES